MKQAVAVPFLLTSIFVSLYLVHVSFEINNIPPTNSACQDLPKQKSAKSSNDAVSTAIAKKDSYGYFDDIPDYMWEKQRQKAQKYQLYNNPYNPNEGISNAQIWYIFNLQPILTCPYVERIGGIDGNAHGDGSKWVCDIDRITKHTIREQTKCLIYSIGSDGNFEFEDTLSKRLNKHCEIHIFDPGNFERPGDVETRNIHYHSWGITSSYDNDPQVVHRVYRNKNNMGIKQFKTIPDTMKELGHEGHPIEIFKIDCEGTTFKDWIGLDIRQILIEVHGTPSPNGRNRFYHDKMSPYELYDAFQDNNFAMFYKEPNTYGGHCVEFSYIKMDPSFWGNKRPLTSKTKRLTLGTVGDTRTSTFARRIQINNGAT